MPGSLLWGYDSVSGEWKPYLVDADGHPQVDVLSTALPTGAATSAKQDTIIGHVDGLETLLGAGLPVALDSLALKVKEQSPITGFATSAKQDTELTELQAKLETAELSIEAITKYLNINVKNLPTEYPLTAAQVADLKNIVVAAALPAGANAIGKLAANSGVDIGDVDVTSLPSVTTATIGAVTVGATSTSVLALNASRKFAVFVNDSNEAIYLALAATAVINQGIRLNPYGGAYEINLLNLYTGAVSAICASGSKLLCVTQG